MKFVIPVVEFLFHWVKYSLSSFPFYSVEQLLANFYAEQLLRICYGIWKARQSVKKSTNDIFSLATDDFS